MDRDEPEGVREATERAAEICQAKRVGVWYLAANGRTLVCEDIYDAARARPYCGRRTLSRRVPEAVRGPRSAGRDRRTPRPERSAHRGVGRALPAAARHRGRAHLADPFGQAPARHAEGRGPVRGDAERRHGASSASRWRACSPCASCRQAGPRLGRRQRSGRLRRDVAGAAESSARSGDRSRGAAAPRCCTSRCRPTISPRGSSSRPPSPVIRLPDWLPTRRRAEERQTARAWMR